MTFHDFQTRLQKGIVSVLVVCISYAAEGQATPQAYSDDDIALEGTNLKPDVYIPTAFSPNGDGLNDLFTPIVHTEFSLRDYRFTIIDRAGRVVFSSTQPGEGWNGAQQGSSYLNTNDVFVYFLELGTNASPEIYQYTGKVSLVR